MSVVRRVAKNTTYLMVGQVVAIALLAVTSVLSVRYLGVNGFGILSLALAFALILEVLVNFGLGTLTTREVAKDVSLASKYLGNIIIIRVLIYLAFISVVVLLVNLLGYNWETTYVIYVISIGVVFTALSGMFTAVLQAFEKMKYQAIGLVLNASLILGGITVAIALNAGVEWFAYAYLVGNALTLLYYCAVYINRFPRFKLELDRTFWKNTMRTAWPMAAMAISIMVYYRVDVVILSFIKGEAAVGYYSVAYLTSEVTLVIPMMFTLSLFPVLSRLHEDSKNMLIDTCVLSVKYLLYLALPMAFFVTLWAHPLITLVFGPAFDGSAYALQIIIWSAVAIYVTIVLGYMLLAVNLQKLHMNLTIILVAVNILSNVLLIPQYSYLGAALSTVITETVALVIFLVALRHSGYTIALHRVSIPPILGLFVITLISSLLFIAQVPLALITAVDIVAYTAIIYKLGLNEQDKRLIAHLLKPLRWKKQCNTQSRHE